MSSHLMASNRVKSPKQKDWEVLTAYDVNETIKIEFFSSQSVNQYFLCEKSHHEIRHGAAQSQEFLGRFFVIRARLFCVLITVYFVYIILTFVMRNWKSTDVLCTTDRVFKTEIFTTFLLKRNARHTISACICEPLKR